MTQGVAVGHNGLLYVPRAISVGNGGTWHNVKGVWVGNAGTWHQCWLLGNLVQPFTAWSVVASPAAGTAANATSLTFLSSGLVGQSGDGTGNGSTNWYSPTTTSIGSQYWISFNNGPFLSLSGGQTYTRAGGSRFGTGIDTVNVRIASDSGGSNIVFTSNGNQVGYTHV